MYVKTTSKICDKRLEKSTSEKQGNKIARSYSFWQTGARLQKVSNTYPILRKRKVQKNKQANEANSEN